MDKKIGQTFSPLPANSNGPVRKPVNGPGSLPAKEGISEFDKILKKDLPDNAGKTPISGDVKLSAHALKRISERKLELDGQEYMKLKEAISKLRNKGGRDSLVITDKAAYIVDVEKNTVVTAIDKHSLSENIFTKIDSTVIVD